MATRSGQSQMLLVCFHIDLCKFCLPFPQSKQGQAIGMATNAGQGQIQLNSSQGTLRFSQPQIVASNSNAQLISSQPVFTSQMIQAMASQLQQFPQQQIMLAQGQTQPLGTGMVKLNSTVMEIEFRKS